MDKASSVLKTFCRASAYLIPFCNLPSVTSLLCPYLCPILSRTHVIVLRIRSSSYYLLSCVNVRGCPLVRAHTFSRNIRAHASLHAHTHSRNARTISRNIRACASASILSHNYVCLFVCERAYVSICARAPVIIRSCSGCYTCLYVVLSNNNQVNSVYFLSYLLIHKGSY